MPLQVLKDLLRKNAGNTQVEQNLLKIYHHITGHQFQSVEAALNA